MSEIFFGASCDGKTRCPSWHKLKVHFRYIGTPYSAVVSAASPPGLIMYTYMSFSESESGGDHGKEVKVKAKSNAKKT